MNQSSPAASPSEKFGAENTQAEEFIDSKDVKAAARILVDIVEKDSGNYRAYNNMGIIAWAEKAWEDAWTMFFKAANLKPDYADALVNLFDAALKLHRIDQAMPLFEKGLASNTSMEEVRIIIDSIKSQGDGIYQSERALHIGVYHPKVDAANKLLADGKMFGAMEKYLDVLDNDGPHPDAFSGLGVISFYQKRYDDAYTLFVESLKLNPTNADNFLNLLDAAKACGKLDAAKKIYDVYRKRFPNLDAVAVDFENA
jgi:tetratricopeptide (TPR) repeat protein